MPTPSAVLTLWYVNAPDPATVLNSEPKADRGFGRKFLAQLNPALPVTPIGQFPLNRSAQAGAGEFYIGGYPGVTVVQTFITDEALTLSQLSPMLLRAHPAAEIFAFASNPDTGYAGIAHWQDLELKRSLCSTRTKFIEDEGLPEPFEAPFWAGEHPAAPQDPSTAGGDFAAGVGLPFNPIELMEEAERHWLGVDISANGPDLDVVGYAVDGRPAPKVDEPKPAPTAAQATSSAAAKLGIGPANGDYDDYADPDSDPEPTISADAAAAARQVAHRVAKGASRLGSAGVRVAERALTFIKRNRR